MLSPRIYSPHGMAGRCSIFFSSFRAKKGGLGPPSKGGEITQDSRHWLGHQIPDTSPCLTAGPDPAGPGDWPLPSAGERLLTFLPPPTVSAHAQSCPHLDVSWWRVSGTPLPTQPHLTVYGERQKPSTNHLMPGSSARAPSPRPPEFIRNKTG